MLKRIFFLFFSVAVLYSCGPSATSGGCTLKGHISLPEYDMAYLCDTGRHPIDSFTIVDGKFEFAVADSVSQPYALLLQFVDREDSLNRMDMPVMVENGEVRIALGEYIRITGTPLNDAVQHFFDGMQACKDRVMAQTDITVDEIRNAFSGFYREQILLNRDNALGSYIYREYFSRLLPSDREAVESQLNQEP